jgi:signal transduction histidine kinase
VSNLLANAVRHSERGSSIGITAQREHESVVVTVENRGQDISSKDLNRIFEPYFRGDLARSGSEGSAGLGLTIVKAIM